MYVTEKKNRTSRLYSVMQTYDNKIPLYVALYTPSRLTIKQSTRAKSVTKTRTSGKNYCKASHPKITNRWQTPKPDYKKTLYVSVLEKTITDLNRKCQGKQKINKLPVIGTKGLQKKSPTKKLSATLQLQNTIYNKMRARKKPSLEVFSKMTEVPSKIEKTAKIRLMKPKTEGNNLPEAKKELNKQPAPLQEKVKEEPEIPEENIEFPEETFKNTIKDELKQNVEECRKPMLNLPSGQVIDALNAKIEENYFGPTNGRKDDCDLVVIDSQSSSQVFVRKCFPTRNMKAPKRTKIPKIEISSYKIRSSPFSDIMDNSISQYLGNTTLEGSVKSRKFRETDYSQGNRTTASLVRKEPHVKASNCPLAESIITLSNSIGFSLESLEQKKYQTIKAICQSKL